MKEILKRASVSNLHRIFIMDSSSTTGQGKTSLTFASSGLNISTITDVESVAVTYTSAASGIETIPTLGTYSTPTSGTCRFKEVDATNHPGLYELQFENSRYNVTNAKKLICTISGPVNVAQVQFEIQLGFDVIFSELVEGSLSYIEYIRIFLAALAGKSSGGGTNTLIFKGADGTTTRITATVDADGNRTAITVNGA